MSLVESLARGGEAHVDVAHDAEGEVGFAAGKRAGVRAEDAVAAEGAKGSEAADEPTA